METTPYYGNIREEELKNRVAADWFADYTTHIIGNIDFCVAVPQREPSIFGFESLMWAEAKLGTKQDIYASFEQLILTIGRASTVNNYNAPVFLGAFDAEKIAFIGFHDILDILYDHDIDWTVAPSDHTSKEFLRIYPRVKGILERTMLLFRFGADAKALRAFIKANFKTGLGRSSRMSINKNNFTSVYQKWAEYVKPSISVDWEAAKKSDRPILDADFYLADLLSADNKTLRDKLFVVINGDHYELNRKLDDLGMLSSQTAWFKDGRVAYDRFWNHFDRPPREEYWNYIIDRRDLLVPQDVRERKGSFFTPHRWVELSQQYIAAALGENWQDEYTVWDCCAGTGNLLAGLANKYNVWASTLDQADVDVMMERIDNGAALLKSHVFRFDFLNDSFDKLPDGLRKIIDDPESRRKLLIYINPPYAEAGNRKVIAAGGGEQKTNVAVSNLTYKKYLDSIGIAGRELFAQFFIRIYKEIQNCHLAEFSKLKILQAPNFQKFRQEFRARLVSNFIVPANTFDNVKGQFPIGFFIWDLGDKQVFGHTVSDVYDSSGNLVGHKGFYSCDGERSINDWMIETRNHPGEKKIGYMSCRSHDFSNVSYNFVMNDKRQMKSPRGTWVTDYNLRETAIYIAVCHSIPATWLNDRDQFLYPNDGWKEDKEFQGDCLAYTLFSNANNIKSSEGVNHWIPFTEEEVGAQEKFESRFMSDYIRGKVKRELKEGEQGSMFGDDAEAKPVAFSAAAQAVMDAGRELWRYYHVQPGANPNASYYDIREYFQGRDEKGRMNADSPDAQYTRLLAALRAAHKALAARIEPRVYACGFLKR